MARSIFASFLLFVTLLVRITSSNAQDSGTGVVLNELEANITGRIVCNPFGGNPIIGLPNDPVVGVNVTLSCNGRRIARAVTNTNGFFHIIVNASNINLFNITRCRVVVPLSVNGTCIFLRGSGSLQASIILTDIVETVGGFILYLVTLPFVLFPF